MDDFVNSLTADQYIELLNIAFGSVPAEVANLTDDELLAELGV